MPLKHDSGLPPVLITTSQPFGLFDSTVIRGHTAATRNPGRTGHNNGSRFFSLKKAALCWGDDFIIGRGPTGPLANKLKLTERWNAS